MVGAALHVSLILLSMSGVIAAWPGKAAAQLAKGDAALGEYLSSECVTCHLPTGKQVGAIPVITGWPDDQFVAVLQSYQRRERGNQVMQTLTSRLSNEEMAALAAYFSKLPPRSQ